jgi:NAD+ kinase
MRTLGLVVNKSKENAVNIALLILDFCDRHGIRVYAEDWIASALKRKEIGKPFEQIRKTADLILVLGGDGTILSTAKKMGGSVTPLLGINLGGLGFLTAVRYQDTGQALEIIRKGGITTERRMMLSAQIVRDGKRAESFDAVNDVVVTKGALARMLNLEVLIDREYLTNYTSDGLIVATPTGSTAHSLSAGGPIVCPDMPALLLTPICPHALGNRPLVMSDTKSVKINIRSNYRNIFLSIDGQVGAQLKYNDEVIVRTSKQTLHLAMCRGTPYYHILREKLHWGGFSKVQ